MIIVMVEAENMNQYSQVLLMKGICIKKKSVMKLMLTYVLNSLSTLSLLTVDPKREPLHQLHPIQGAGLRMCALCTETSLHLRGLLELHSREKQQ